MSIKINLSFDVFPDLAALEDNILIELFRITADVKFRSRNGWKGPFTAIVDTGSPMMLIPRFIWDEIEYETLSPREYGILGISPPGTERIPATLARVTGSFADTQRLSPPVEIRCRLLSDNNIPLVIGFLDILTTFTFFSDYKTCTAYLEL